MRESLSKHTRKVYVEIRNTSKIPVDTRKFT